MENNVILAPLAGITNLPFRLLAKASGCGLVCSEMISSNGLVYGSPKTIRLLDSTPAEKPLSVQIFGADPAIMAEAARRVEASGADILDINLGCSVRKVVKTGAGVALMRTPDLAAEIFNAVRKAIQIPLTIKIRSGWDPSGDQALRIALLAQDGGVDAIAMHPRTASQGFRGKADWTRIAVLRGQVDIPVIGNGDINTAEDAEAMLGQTGCNGVMVGRAAIGRPLLFSQIIARLQGEPEPDFDLAAHFEMMRRFLFASIEYFGETHACYMMRSRLGWFVKGLPNSSHFREAIKTIRSREDALERLAMYHRQLAEKTTGG